MRQVQLLLFVGVLVGSAMAWKAPLDGLRRAGGRVALVCLGLWIVLIVVAHILVWLGLAVVLVAAACGAYYASKGHWPRLLGATTRGAPAQTVSSARLEPGFAPFVGKASKELRTVQAEDTIGVIGPPRSGKTAGILIPQAMMWAGPMISVSVREDILRSVGDQRLRIAEPYGGQVYVFDPADSSRADLVRLAEGDSGRIAFIQWSPVDGCRVPEVAKLRAEAMTWASLPTDGSSSRNPHFERLGSTLLRTMFHAADLTARGLPEVLAWIDAKDTLEPANLIRNSDSTERMSWSNELLGLAQLAPEERGSAFSTAGNALDAFKLSTVLRNCSRTDIQLRQFVSSRSSLFVIAGVGLQQALAPLFSAMLESIAFELIDGLAREDGGRLEPRLLLQLDELANIAPLPNLLRLLTLCGGSGVCLSYASQNWQQLAARYGQDQMRSIWQSTKAQVVFGGVGDMDMLKTMSELMGRRTKKTRTTSRGRLSLPGKGTVSTSEQEVPRLYTDEIFSAARYAHLFYNRDFEHVEPALYFDPVLGQPFHQAAGWSPARQTRV